MGEGVLIIGIGNPLRGDDGFGPAVLARLEAAGTPGNVRLAATHQLVPELVEEFSGVQRVVFVDARVPAGAAAQDIRFERIEGEGSARDTLTHEFPPHALMHLAKLMTGRAPAAWTLSAPAADLSPGEGLSPSCQAHAETAVQMLQEWLAADAV